MAEQHGWLLEIGDRKPQFFPGRGAALERAHKAGKKLARRLGIPRFYLVDAISAVVYTYDVTLDRISPPPGSQNPTASLHGTVNDIPAQWTPCMVRKIGKAVQIKMRGR